MGAARTAAQAGAGSTQSPRPGKAGDGAHSRPGREKLGRGRADNWPGKAGGRCAQPPRPGKARDVAHRRPGREKPGPGRTAAQARAGSAQPPRPGAGRTAAQAGVIPAGAGAQGRTGRENTPESARRQAPAGEKTSFFSDFYKFFKVFQSFFKFIQVFSSFFKFFKVFVKFSVGF